MVVNDKGVVRLSNNKDRVNSWICARNKRLALTKR
jgi:hypothetical protein